LARSAIIVVNVWRGLPFFAITILAGLVAIPKELYEAAEADGAGKVSRGKAVGKLIAERAKAAGVTRVVFDRAGYRYHGRVQAVAEGAREGGLEF